MYQVLKFDLENPDYLDAVNNRYASSGVLLHVLRSGNIAVFVGGGRDLIQIRPDLPSHEELHLMGTWGQNHMRSTHPEFERALDAQGEIVYVPRPLEREAPRRVKVSEREGPPPTLCLDLDLSLID